MMTLLAETKQLPLISAAEFALTLQFIGLVCLIYISWSLGRIAGFLKCCDKGKEGCSDDKSHGSCG